MGTAEGERVESDVKKRMMRLGPLQSPARPVAYGDPFALRQQQVAITIALQRIKQRVLGLPRLLPTLGVGEQTLGFLKSAGGAQRVGAGCLIVHHLKFV